MISKKITLGSLAKKILPLFFLFIMPQLALAQEIVFRATVNKNNVQLGETFQISFTLENADGKRFTPPSFNDFYKVGGPNQSTNMQFVNGNMTRSQSFSYYLQPKKEGTFTIQPAVIEVNGKALKTNSIILNVNKSGSQNSAGNNPSENRNAPASIEDQIKENVFIKLFVDKSNVYQGEQLTATYKLYKRLPITAISIEKAPAFNGFWNYTLEEIQQLSYQREIINGVQFEVADLKKSVLFPQKAGELSVDEMALNITVRVQAQSRSRSIWDDFFGAYQDIPLIIQSNTAKIKVKPLPSINKPAQFSGVVGKFKMDASFDKTEVEVDEPITLNIKITGTGNIKMIEPLKLELPNDFDVFDPKINESSKKGSTSGSKTFDYLIVPRRPGEFKIPELKFTYFDIEKNEYITHTSNETIIKITGEASASASSQNVINIKKEEIELLGQDIRYIKTNSTFQNNAAYFFATPSYFGTYVAPILIFIGLIFYRKKEKETNSNIALLKKRKAGKVAVQKLSLAKKWMDAQNKNNFCDETVKALWGFLSDKLNLPTSELSKNNALQLLQEKGIQKNHSDELFQIIETCEIALFAGTIATLNMNEIYQKAEKIINEIDAQLS